MLQFQSCVSDITCYNDNASEIFGYLQSAAEQLLNEEENLKNNRTLDHTVMDQLLGFDGVLDFLSLLGYKSDDMGSKLVCLSTPNRDMVTCAIKVLQTYRARLRINNNDDDDEKQQDTLTLQQIIIWSTHENMHDVNTHELMDALILTHKQFTNSRTLFYHLRERCDNVPLPPQLRVHGHGQDQDDAIHQFQNTVLKIILIKVFRSISVWIVNYWALDFADNSELQHDMTAWFAELQQHKHGKYQHLQWFRYLVDNMIEMFEQQRTRAMVDAENDCALMVANTVIGDMPAVSTGDMPHHAIDKKLLRKHYRLHPNIGTAELAQQITLMHYRIFVAIASRECVGLKWKKKDRKSSEAPHILAMIELFNEWVLFVQLQILMEDGVKQRAKTIKFMIELCTQLQALQNYDALRAVLTALNSSAVYRLKFAWQSVSKSAMHQFEELKRLFDISKNSKNYRCMFRDCLPPAIPYFGLFLQDLVFIEEGIEKRQQVDDFKEHGAFINFNKSVRTADRIKEWLIRYQIKSGYDGKCTPNVALQRLFYQQLRAIKDLSEKDIWNMSSEAKKSDEKRSSSGRLSGVIFALLD